MRKEGLIQWEVTVHRSAWEWRCGTLSHMILAPWSGRSVVHVLNMLSSSWHDLEWAVSPRILLLERTQPVALGSRRTYVCSERSGQWQRSAGNTAWPLVCCCPEGLREGSQISAQGEHRTDTSFFGCQETCLWDLKLRTDKDFQVPGTLLLTPSLQARLTASTRRARGECLCKPELESSRCLKDAH